MHFSGIVNLHAFLRLRVSCSVCECLHHLLCVILCASVCALAWSSLVHHHHPPCTAPWLQEPGRIWGHGLAQAWSLWMAVGKEGSQGGGPYIPARSKTARAAPAFTPVTSASAACLPTHERLLEMLSPCLANPQPEGPGARGQLPVSSAGAVRNFLTSSNRQGSWSRQTPFWARGHGGACLGTTVHVNGDE